MQYLRPIPIPCPSCGASAQPRTYIRRTPTDIITEATWHCTACGRFIKQGTISAEPIVK